MKLPVHTILEIQKHALAEFPKEAAGLIVNGNFVACKNVHEDPLNHFKIDPVDQVQASFLGDIQAVIHSHPSDKKDRRIRRETPTYTDMVQYLKGSIPWGILAVDGEACTDLVWLDDNDRPPLLGREFLHGVADCYSIIRDFYRNEYSIILKDYARPSDWWNTDLNLYMDYFKAEGFDVIEESQLKPGDCILFTYRHHKVNHAAIYMGEGNIMHQLMGRSKLSCIEPLQRYQSSIYNFVRHEDVNQEVKNGK